MLGFMVQVVSLDLLCEGSEVSPCDAQQLCSHPNSSSTPHGLPLWRRGLCREQGGEIGLDHAHLPLPRVLTACVLVSFLPL